MKLKILRWKETTTLALTNFSAFAHSSSAPAAATQPSNPNWIPGDGEIWRAYGDIGPTRRDAEDFRNPDSISASDDSDDREAGRVRHAREREARRWVGVDEKRRFQRMSDREFREWVGGIGVLGREEEMEERFEEWAREREGCRGEESNL